MAGATGLEPATSGVTGQRCNQLYYAPAAETVCSKGVTGVQERVRKKQSKKNQIFPQFFSASIAPRASKPS